MRRGVAGIRHWATGSRRLPRMEVEDADGHSFGLSACMLRLDLKLTRDNINRHDV